MNEKAKRIYTMYVTPETIDKLDALAKDQKRNRSLQIAFLIEQAHRQMVEANLVHKLAEEVNALHSA